MKVLYIGNWKDGTGWGNAAQNNILALDSANVNVVPRAIRLNNREDTYIPERLKELEENDEQGCDVCIQHLLPDMMERGPFDLNVGIHMTETSHFNQTLWARHLNMMDQVWVANNAMLGTNYRSHIYAPTAVVPLCFDLSRYSRPYDPYPIPEAQDKFVFYFIGEITRRKNLTGLLRAFHLAFDPSEPVCLLIKGHVPGKSQMDSHRIISGMVADIKRGMRLYPSEQDYLNEIVITQWLSDKELMRLHTTGDCFVMPSYGEAWCIPGFEAMAMGNPTILSNEGGPRDFIEDGFNGMLIPGRYESVLIRPEEVPYPHIWTAREDWFSPDLSELKRMMRKVYEDAEFREQLSDKGIDVSYEYSLQKVGQKMKELLDGTTQPVVHNRLTSVRKVHDLQALVGLPV